MLRSNMYMVMGGEGEEDPKLNGEEDTKPAEKSASELELEVKVANLAKSNETLTANNKELEKLLLDPTYTEFLAGKTKTEKKDLETAFDDMTNGQLIGHITKIIKDEVGGAVKGVKGEYAVEETKKEVVRLAKLYPDYNLYVPEMMKIAKENPTLTPERIFKLAKAETGPRKPKVVSGVLPGNTDKEGVIIPKGFPDQFEQGWKDSGIEKVLKEVT